MNIQTLPLSRLLPAPYNPRVPLVPGSDRYERLAASLDAFDLVQPLVWNRRSGHLVGGHQRATILADRGVTETTCVVVDLDEEHEKALNVALNNDRVGSRFDSAALQTVLDELEAGGIDHTLTGFSQTDFDEFRLEPVADFEPLAEPAGNQGTATIEVPREHWEPTRAWVDALLAETPQVRVHIDPPSAA